MNDASPQEREVAHWKAWQEQAESVWGWRTPAGQIRSRRRARLFQELGRMTSQSLVLEIGCGTGEFTQQIAPKVGQLHAIDLSPDLLARAAAKMRATCPGANTVFELQDAMNLRFPANRFDAVFGCSILHHVDARLALAEVHRVLKPSGWCVFSEPNMLNPQIALQKNIGFIKQRMGDSPDETAFFSWQLRRWLGQLGFGEISVRHFDFLHPLTPRVCLPAMEKLGAALEVCPVVRSISGSLLCCAQKPPLNPDRTA
jgi:SAM-dependent methyltransferase